MGNWIATWKVACTTQKQSKGPSGGFGQGEKVASTLRRMKNVSFLDTAGAGKACSLCGPLECPLALTVLVSFSWQSFSAINHYRPHSRFNHSSVVLLVSYCHVTGSGVSDAPNSLKTHIYYLKLLSNVSDNTQSPREPPDLVICLFACWL